MGFILIIFLIVGIIFGIVKIVAHRLFLAKLKDRFKHCNVIVFGAKGNGKDLVFDYTIRKRHQPYYSNIPYTYGNEDIKGLNTMTLEEYKEISKDNQKNKVIELKSINCEPNNYYQIVSGNIVRTEHRFKESADIYVSDIGIYLPSYMDNKLYNQFPSMPVFYSLSRQLYLNNVHCNTQNLERAWKALREQADFFVWARKTLKFPFIVATKVTMYDKYKSANDRLEPLKSRMFNKQSKANYDLYKCQNGFIQTGWIIQLKRKIKYDTRYFEKVLLNGERRQVL